jgi:hypothetical protein
MSAPFRWYRAEIKLAIKPGRDPTFPNQRRFALIATFLVLQCVLGSSVGERSVAGQNLHAQITCRCLATSRGPWQRVDQKLIN